MKKKNILVDMSATILHYGHIRILKKASQLGNVIVGLTKDSEIKKYKGFKPYGYSKNELVELPTTRFGPGDIIYDPLNAEFLVFDNAGGTYRLNPLTYEIEE